MCASFNLISSFQPAGDQPKAIHEITQNFANGSPLQVLKGVTGSGKTFTMANIIKQLNLPTLIIAHNKTLAAQLCSELKDFFPTNSVEYFVSFYDYYQPEAYIPHTDTYIEKDTAINEEIERLRHSATMNLLSRKDVIIVASVSCIYGLGSPDVYVEGSIELHIKQKIRRDNFLELLIAIKYERNDIALSRGKFRVRGDIIELIPAYETRVLRIEFFGDDIEQLTLVDFVTGEKTQSLTQFFLFPATHYLTLPNTLEAMIEKIESELSERLLQFKSRDMHVEYQRLEQRTRYDLEMLKEIGYCNGIENYSRHLAGRQSGEPPDTLIDYFPKEFLMIVDESHVTLPQIRGMFAGDRSRKTVLVDYGFRLPSALDNRPLNFDEYFGKIHKALFVSATPGDFEINTVGNDCVIEQIIRPTGLLDPMIEVRGTKGQIEDIMKEINGRIAHNERVLVVTLTKKMAEELTNYLHKYEIKARYMHADVDTLDRIDILHDLRVGLFDVLIGINLLREGLDLPEVSLVAILDADKEGFLRNERSLIQTIGRAARNAQGLVLLYADKITESMKRAMQETNRRRTIQEKFNIEHGITPTTILKSVKDNVREVPINVRKKHDKRQRQLDHKLDYLFNPDTLKADELPQLITDLRHEMDQAAKNLEFEKAAVIRDYLRAIT